MMTNDGARVEIGARAPHFEISGRAPLAAHVAMSAGFAQAVNA
jgi:hypothetical protein